MKREIKQENIYRVLRVCPNRESVDQYMREYSNEIRSRKLKPEISGRVLSYKADRVRLVRIMFLTPTEAERVKGKRYNEVKILGDADKHPIFKEFMEDIAPYKISQLFE